MQGIKKVQMPLPVFLPGNDRDWKEIKGVAEISADGEIHIKLERKEAGLELFQMQQDGILFALGFDYMGPAKEKKP